MNQSESILLIIDSSGVNKSNIFKSLTSLFERTPDSENYQLHILLYIDDPEDHIRSFINDHWKGPLKFMDSALLMQDLGMSVREDITAFVELIRIRLQDLAQTINGKSWAKRFEKLWWYSEISEKNSPGHLLWWQIFRFEIIKRIMVNNRYAKCLLAGGDNLDYLVSQLCCKLNISYQGSMISRARFQLISSLAVRFIGGLSYVFAIIISGRVKKDKTGSLFKKSGKILLYTWYPRVWTKRSGTWQDMYYGLTMEALKKDETVEPSFVLRIYDKTHFVSPLTYWKRIKLLKKPEYNPGRFFILESFTSPLIALKKYISFRDIINYVKLSRLPDFSDVFKLDGVNYKDVIVPRLARSVYVLWPNLEILENSAMNLTRALHPSVVLLYCFEYMYGRAIIHGTRAAGGDVKIAGMQHGPITWMKFLYSGISDASDKKNVTEPDYYTVDGKIASDILSKGGIELSRIKTTGPARFDTLWERVNKIERVKKNSYEERIKVLVAPGLHDTDFMLRFVLKALIIDKRLQLIIKPHPKVSLNSVLNLVKALQAGGNAEGADVRVVREGEIYTWMEKSDIFISTYSSTGVEALAFELPVILLLSGRVPDMSLFYKTNYPVLSAQTPEDLRMHVDRLIKDPAFLNSYVNRLKNVLYESFGETNAKASERLARFCSELANSKTMSYKS